MRHPAENPTLTPTETEVSRLVALGLSNKQIAFECGVPYSMVERQIFGIFRKIGVANRVQLALEWHGIAWRGDAA
jgi:DNA-binding NarL/FixJ family response regulator